MALVLLISPFSLQGQGNVCGAARRARPTAASRAVPEPCVASCVHHALLSLPSRPPAAIAMSSQLHTIHKLHADGSSVAVAEAANSSGDVGTQAVSRSSARARSCLLTAPLPQQTGTSVLPPDDGALQPSDTSSGGKMKFEQPDEPIQAADSCETAPGTCDKQPRPVPVPPAAGFDLDASRSPAG